MNEFATTGPDPEPAWDQLGPHIDDALASLREKDRHILLLRYFQAKTVRDVGQTLGMSEDAVQKRASRAVDKLRHYFAIRGIGVSALTLLAGMTANASPSAPAALVPTVMAAVATPVSAGAAVLTLVEASVHLLAGPKLLLSAAAALAVATLVPVGAFVLLQNSYASATVVFDLSRDFSLRTNPNGPWSFGAKETPDGPMTLSEFRRITSLNEETWAFARGRWPVVYYNPTTNTILSAGGRFAPGAVWYAAGEDGTTRNFGVIRFTVPDAAAGKYRLETEAASALEGMEAGDADFHVVLNGATLYERNVVRGSRADYTNEVTLAAGHTIDLLVGRGADGRQRASILKVQARFTLLP